LQVPYRVKKMKSGVVGILVCGMELHHWCNGWCLPLVVCDAFVHWWRNLTMPYTGRK
jgi:hypothetical protein